MNEQRERAALLKIKMLGMLIVTGEPVLISSIIVCLCLCRTVEESNEQRNKLNGADTNELKRKIKNMESQQQVVIRIRAIAQAAQH